MRPDYLLGIPKASGWQPTAARAEVDAGHPARALWVTSAPVAQYVKHEWAGAWVCSAFRNEGAGRSSELIREAIAASIYVLQRPPELGMVTFIDPEFVRTANQPGLNALGWCYRKAGFEVAGKTQGGLLALRLPLDRMPAPNPPHHGAASKYSSRTRLPLFDGERR